MTDVHLVPLTEAHLPAIEALLDDPAVLAFTRFPEPPRPDGWLAEWFGRYERGRTDGTCRAFAAVDADGSFLGLALAPHIDAPANEVELGYVVSPQARGRGVATESLVQLTGWAFDELGAQRIQLYIDVDNKASQRVAERVGYQFEGVLRSTWLKGDLRSDTGVWSLLPSDPRPGEL